METRPGQILAVALFVLAGCGGGERANEFENRNFSVTLGAADVPDPAVAGTWRLAFDADRFQVTVDGSPAANGTFSVVGNQLTLTDLGGPLACLESPEQASGTYSWSLEANRLSFAAGVDDCAPRRAVLTATAWTKE